MAIADVTEWPDVDGLHETILNETYPGNSLPVENRGSWYNPCVTPADGRHIAELCRLNDTQVVYDLGAGDLRLSVYLARCGFPVIAYETVADILHVAESWYDSGDLDGVTIRCRDYYGDWRHIRPGSEKTAYVAIGKQNELPAVPRKGIGIQGYDNDGINCWISGRVHCCDDCPEWWYFR